MTALLQRILKAKNELEIAELLQTATEEELEAAEAAAKGGATVGPPNWKASSAQKFAKTVNITDMDKCIAKMKGRVNDPGAFCQAVHKFTTGKPNVPGNAAESAPDDAVNLLAQELELEDFPIMFTELLPESEGRTQLEEAGVVAVAIDDEDGAARTLTAEECEEYMNGKMKKRDGGDASKSMMMKQMKASESAPVEIEVQEETRQGEDLSAVGWEDKTMTIKGVTILRPGTSLNNRHYSKEAIQNGFRIFEGTKMYTDHPPKAAAAGPRRISDLMSKVTRTYVDQESGALKGDVKVFRRDFYEFCHEAADTIGISINALCKGIPNYPLEGKRVDYIQEFVRGHSTDWVTDAGAGGGILVQESFSEEELVDVLKELTVQELRDERPDIVTELVQEANAARDAAVEERDAAVKELEETKTEIQHQQELQESNKRVREYLAQESKLPPQAQERIASRFSEIVVLEAEVSSKLDAAIKDERGYIQSVGGVASGRITNVGESGSNGNGSSDKGSSVGPINQQLDAVLGIPSASDD